MRNMTAPGPPATMNQNSVPKTASLPFSSSDSALALVNSVSLALVVSRLTMRAVSRRALGRSFCASASAIGRLWSRRLRRPSAK
jgi:hypothetical protein